MRPSLVLGPSLVMRVFPVGRVSKVPRVFLVMRLRIVVMHRPAHAFAAMHVTICTIIQMQDIQEM